MKKQIRVAEVKTDGKFYWNGLTCKKTSTPVGFTVSNCDHNGAQFYLPNETMVEVEAKSTFAELPNGTRFRDGSSMYVKIIPTKGNRWNAVRISSAPSPEYFYFYGCEVEVVE